jgi:hypothetical protein
MRAKSGKEGGKWLRRQCRDDKWNAKAERIDRVQGRLSSARMSDQIIFFGSMHAFTVTAR